MDQLTDYFMTLRRPLLEFAYSRIGNLAKAEDLVQDVFVRACRYHPYSKNWFYRCLRTVMIDHSRYNRRVDWGEVEMDPQIGDGERVEETVLARVMLLQCMARLTAEQAQLIRLELAGYTHAEIAQLLHKTEGAVKSLQHRAFTALVSPKSDGRRKEHARFPD